MSVRVSVIVAAYNQGPYLGEALDSILSQNGPTFEVIVVDDASTDNTPEVLGRYVGRVRTIHLMKNNGGPAAPRNVAIKAAAGEFIAIFDGDDVMLPGKLAEFVAFMDACPDVPFVFSNFRNFQDSGTDEADFLADHDDFRDMRKEKVGEGWYILPQAAAYDILIGDNFIGTSSVVFRRSLVSQVGFFDEKLKRSEDIEYWYRIARRRDLGFIDKVTHRRRLHGSNISSGPAALQAKIDIYRRQDPGRLSAAARRKMNVMLGRLYFSIGYLERRNGRRWPAIRNYLSSLACHFNGGRALVSIVVALLPGSRALKN